MATKPVTMATGTVTVASSACMLTMDDVKMEHRQVTMVTGMVASTLARNPPAEVEEGSSPLEFDKLYRNLKNIKNSSVLLKF